VFAARNVNPRGWIIVAGERHGVWLAAVAHFGEGGRVALAREVEEDDVLARGDEARSLDALAVGQVAAAAGDAVLEELWTGGLGLHARAVVGFDRKGVDAVQVADEFFGGAADVGGEAEGRGGSLDAEGDDAEFIVALEDGADGEALGEFEGALVDFASAVKEASAFGAGAVALVEMEAGEVGKVPGPGWVAMVGVEVGEEDARDGDVFEADVFEELARAAWREAKIDEEERPLIAVRVEECRAVAGGTAGEDAEGEGVMKR
jgi:hypothetical protein